MNKQTQRPLQAIILGVSLIVAAIIIGNVVIKFVDQNRYVSVKGLSEREYPADRVIWPIIIRETGNNLTLISQAAEQKIVMLQEFLLENGLSKDELSTSVAEMFDVQADRYASSERVANRYILTNVITVSSSKVDLVRGLMARQGELLQKGIAITTGDYRHNISYQYTKLNDIKVDMIEEASSNARASAEQFANDSHSKLGKIKQASQGQISITDRDANSPYIKRIRVVTSVTYFLKD